MDIRRALVMAGALAFASAASANIMTVQLSTNSSDETDPSVLLATVDFAVVGNSLTISVTNDTSGLDSYNINEVYFNFGGGVSDVSDGGQPTGWTFGTDFLVNGFGFFDFGSTDGVGGDPNTIMPGETLDFLFTFNGVGGVKDFTTALSTNGFVVAAKFVAGPDDDSAFGASVPAPGVLALLGVAGVVGTRRRRRS